MKRKKPNKTMPCDFWGTPEHEAWEKKNIKDTRHMKSVVDKFDHIAYQNFIYNNGLNKD